MLSAAVLGRRLAPSQPAQHRVARRASCPRLVSRRAAPACFAESGKANKAAHTKADTVEVQFRLTRRVPFGQELVVVGSVDALGAWDAGRGAPMTWHDGDVWEAHVKLPAGAPIEFKFVQQVPESAPVWESCLNRTLAVQGSCDLETVWDAPLATVYHDHHSPASDAEADGTGSEDDLPPPFRAAEALEQFTEVVWQSLDTFANGSGSADSAAPADADAAATGATAQALVADVVAADAPAAVAAVLYEQAAQAKAADKAAGQDKGKGGSKGVKLPAHAEAAVSEIIEQQGGEGPTGAAARAETAAAPAPPAPSGGGGAFKSLSKTAVGVAGTVALGMAAAGMMSALAIDITDAAVLGAVTAGAAAALSTPSAGSKRSQSAKSKALSSTEGEAATGEGAAAAEGTGEKEVFIAQKASAPGVILAAGVLSAIDAGKRMMEPSGPSAGASSAASKRAASARKQSGDK